MRKLHPENLAANNKTSCKYFYLFAVNFVFLYFYFLVILFHAIYSFIKLILPISSPYCKQLTRYSDCCAGTIDRTAASRCAPANKGFNIIIIFFACRYCCR